MPIKVREQSYTTSRDTIAAGGLDIGAIVGQVASGGIGGGALLAIVGVVRGMIGK